MRFHATAEGNIPFTAEEELEADQREAEYLAGLLIVKVPQSVTPLQGLLAIDTAGMSTAYEAWANDPTRTFAENAFINRAQVWKRNDPLMIGAATALGMNEAQLDELFVLAGTL